MAWLDAVDGYCERLGPGYGAEPVNALSNLAFLLAAGVMWPRLRGLPLARAMVALLTVIGIGSYLFHSHANRLTGVMDVAPIAGFILLYVFAASRDMLGLRGAGRQPRRHWPFCPMRRCRCPCGPWCPVWDHRQAMHQCRF